MLSYCKNNKNNKEKRRENKNSGLAGTTKGWHGLAQTM